MVKAIGKFVVLEGIEGCGKSTLLHSLTKHYQSEGLPHISTREPGGTKLGESIRETVLKSKDIAIDSLSELLLIEAARHQHCVEVIQPALHTHRLVLCDRFTLSSLAYQGKARGLPLSLVHQLNSIAIGSCTPDLTLFISLTVKQAHARRARRQLHNPMSVDKMELENLDFHERVAAGYQEAFAFEKDIQTLEGDVTPAELLAGAIRAIDGLL